MIVIVLLILGVVLVFSVIIWVLVIMAMYFFSLSLGYTHDSLRLEMMLFDGGGCCIYSFRLFILWKVYISPLTMAQRLLGILVYVGSHCSTGLEIQCSSLSWLSNILLRIQLLICWILKKIYCVCVCVYLCFS